MPYDITIKKVAIAGATGKLGSAIITELLRSGLFDITVLTRDPSTHTFPDGLQVVKVDYGNVESLVTPLHGQDALVSAVPTGAILEQRLLIDAAVTAGVKRFIPSEFGCDLKNAKARALPVFTSKVNIEDYLRELAEKGVISYTLIYNGPFLDMGLEYSMFLNFKDRKAEIYDGGDQEFSCIRLATAGKIVRRVLTHPRETADRAVWVKEIDISQNKLLQLAQSLTPGEKWEVTYVDTAELEKQCLEQIRDNQDGPQTMLNLLKCAVFGHGYGSKFEHVHNGTLGIRTITTSDLEELVARVLRTKALE
ncbi:hypothetical protein BP6252_10814 [Coleophoma cylindrospora]|uniref:NmrA-like domain-containing protein n=1 Tax=Coleophoma cylindrospora TaxID=1849047 RepID=A0A3D8QNB1_9HELO|nr:hypothetical protein BP6252_10814 [Coleophoma cylindrospora]